MTTPMWRSVLLSGPSLGSSSHRPTTTDGDGVVSSTAPRRSLSSCMTCLSGGCTRPPADSRHLPCTGYVARDFRWRTYSTSSRTERRSRSRARFSGLGDDLLSKCVTVRTRRGVKERPEVGHQRRRKPLAEAPEPHSPLILIEKRAKMRVRGYLEHLVADLLVAEIQPV
jgi:hypothetical protein